MATKAGYVDDAWKVPQFLALWNAERGNHESSLALLGDTLEKIKETIDNHLNRSVALFERTEDGRILGPFPMICRSLLTSCAELGYDAVQQQMFVTRVLNVISRYSSHFPGAYDACNKVIGHHFRELELKSQN